MDGLPRVVSGSELSNGFLGNLVQVGFVTRDHRSAMERMVRLGIGPWTIRTASEGDFTDIIYRGKPVTLSAEVLLRGNAEYGLGDRGAGRWSVHLRRASRPSWRRSATSGLQL